MFWNSKQPEQKYRLQEHSINISFCLKNSTISLIGQQFLWIEWWLFYGLGHQCCVIDVLENMKSEIKSISNDTTELIFEKQKTYYLSYWKGNHSQDLSHWIYMEMHISSLNHTNTILRSIINLNPIRCLHYGTRALLLNGYVSGRFPHGDHAADSRTKHSNQLQRLLSDNHSQIPMLKRWCVIGKCSRIVCLTVLQRCIWIN